MLAALAVMFWMLAVFVAPGMLVLAAARVSLGRTERFAFEVATSLALLTATFALCLSLGFSIAAGPYVLAGVTALAATVAYGYFHETLEDPSPRADSPAASRWILAALVVLGAGLAVSFAPVGSVDRWWYLAYVRAWIDAPVLSLAEPFLGTGQQFARFGVHPWLFGLATVSWLSGVDPVLVYERAAPALVVVASASAAKLFAIELFGDGRRARLCIVATLLLWSGSVLPVYARAGEDKVLAAAALFPICAVAFLRVLRVSSRANWLMLVAAAVATAAVHALAYAFALLIVLPLAGLLAIRNKTRRRSTAIATAILVAVAVAPALSGVAVQSRLRGIGAQLDVHDHPVVRVHEARDRLLELPAAGYVVSPRLLMHPIVLLAFVGLIVVLGRQPMDVETEKATRQTRVRGPARVYLLVAFCVPFALAFIPPLPLVAGYVIPPWMVYRVLWLLPLAPLAAIAAERFGRGETGAMLILLLLGSPVLVLGARERLDDVRERLAAPRTSEFRELIEAVHALPPDALVVAAPELAERLPALAARHVVAGLDRSTVVFSGSRDAGEARLRARAAALAGDEDAGTLAEAAGVAPTHAIFDPRSNDQPRCGTILHAGATAALCTLEHTPRHARTIAIMPAVPDAPRRVLLEGDCGRPLQPKRRDPWTAATPIATCRVMVPFDFADRDDLLLLIEASTGRAADELRIRIEGEEMPDAMAVARISGGSGAAVKLPRMGPGALHIRIASAFLPFVHPVRIALVTR